MDKDTQKLLTDGDHVKNMTESDGWNIVKPKLDARILDLQNIANLDATKPLEAQVLGRMLAAAEMYAWLKDDVYGFIEQQETNNREVQEADAGYIQSSE